MDDERNLVQAEYQVHAAGGQNVFAGGSFSGRARRLSERPDLPYERPE
jgi:hypothetical protein